MKSVVKEDCFKYLPGNGCNLPVAARHYGTGGEIKIQLPGHLRIPSIVKEFLDGGIKVHASIEANGSEIICTDTKIYIDF